MRRFEFSRPSYAVGLCALCQVPALTAFALPARCGRGGGQRCAATGRNAGGTPAVAVSSARPAIGRAACPVGTSTWCLGFVFGGKVHVSPARSIFSNALNLLLCNRGLGPLAVTVLPIALARRAAATACAAVQSTAALFCRWRSARLPAPGPGSTLTSCLKLNRLLVSLLRVHSLAVHFFGTPSLGG
jgi:hypothetical protein